MQWPHGFSRYGALRNVTPRLQPPTHIDACAADGCMSTRTATIWLRSSYISSVQLAPARHTGQPPTGSSSSSRARRDRISRIRVCHVSRQNWQKMCVQSTERTGVAGWRIASRQMWHTTVVSSDAESSISACAVWNISAVAGRGASVRGGAVTSPTKDGERYIP